MTETKSTLNASERRAYAALARRSTQLAKIAGVAANGTRIDPVIGRIGGQVVRTLAALCGEEVLRDLFGFITHQMREAHGLCICGRGKKKTTDPLCADCLTEMEQMDRELEQSELLDKADEGRPQ